MAAMLKFPHYIWQSFAHTSGLNLVKLIEMADTHDDIETLAKILQIWLIRTCLSTNSKCDGLRHFLGSIGFFWLGKRQRTYLAGLVLFIKLTYLVVSVGLHLSLNFFIDEDFMWYGYEVFENYLRGIPQFSARFPAQTLCDMEVRESTTNVNRYTVQCILPINRYSEKIFIFVWFWLLMLIIINGWSLFKWGIRLLSPSDRRRFVQGYVEITLYLMKMQKRKDGAKDDNDSNSHGEDGASYSSSTTASLRPLASNSIVVNTHDKPRGRRRKFVQNALSVQNTLNELFANGFVFRAQDLHIEASEQEAIEFEQREKEKAAELKRRKRIDRITSRMMKRFGHDGVVVFRTLEDAVGVIMANQIFQELYVQLNASLHYS
ncbi:unnamed protein product [Lymnaea stagnalis]|uniref:Innexin n=1 Tax=Lymnaea stagnalis TaxID=6523 RepID=A0AAV2H972_LYMST